MDPFSKENKSTTEKPAVTPPSTSAVPASPAGPVTPPPTVTPVTPVKPSPTVSTSATTPVTPLTPTTPPSQSADPVQTGHVEKSNKLLYVFIGVLLLILFALIGLFFYNQVSSSNTAESEIVVPTTEPQATPTIVVPTYASEEEKEVMGVEVGSVDSQLNIIEDEANKL